MTTAGPGHGFDDDTSTAPMRAMPPALALRWVTDALDGVSIEQVETQRGGTSSAMHVITVRDRHDDATRVVLRRYVRPELHPVEIVAHEVEAIAIASTTAVPVPRVLAWDATGRSCDAPAVLMTFLDGRPVWEPSNRARWCARLADALIALHGAHVPPDATLPAFRPYRQAAYEPPAWAAHPDVWEHAVELLHTAAPAEPPSFIHRDFHPGNVLWRRGRLTGVVDWQYGCIGPPAADVGHNRLNLMLADESLARQFTAAWETAAGTTYDPWGDVVAIIGLLDGLRAHPPGERARRAIEDALADALAARGRS